MAALAEILVAQGAVVSGSDVADRFYTDELLERIGVIPHVGFSAQHLDPHVTILVHSAAYGPDNPELAEAERRRIPRFSYTQALGALSKRAFSVAVSGVHGKTTTTAMIGALVDELQLPATVVVGSAVSAFGGSATLQRGNRFLIAETCEYRRHFLDFHPSVALITSIEPDHQDYFRDRADIESAFLELTRRLPPGGTVIVCADDEGAMRVGAAAQHERADLLVETYGRSGSATWRIVDERVEAGAAHFRIRGLDGAFRLRVSGRHNVLNAAAALAVMVTLCGGAGFNQDAAARALEQFSGTRRRCELIAQVGGVTVLDDYAHHPTAIRTTLAGLKEFYPQSRLLVSFMSHTYTRTAALFDEFAAAFTVADHVVVHEIYASARESARAGVSGSALAEAMAEWHPSVLFEPNFEAAAQHLARMACPGDIILTMGAGNNFQVGKRVVELLTEQHG